MVLTPILLYASWHNSWALALSLVIFLSPLLARSHWPRFGETSGFAAWRRYFEFRVLREGGHFSQTKNVLLAFAPHGLFPLALPLMSAPCHEIFPEFEGRIPRTAVASVLLWAPILSPILVWLGCIHASKQSIHEHLREGSVIILPDGIAGAFHSKRTEETLYIEKRHGFIRTALKEGSLLVPVYCFGHSQLYDVYPDEHSFVARLSRRLQFSLIWFWGARWCPPLPRRVPLLVAIGSGIRVEKQENPTHAQVLELHALFKRELLKLYMRHRLEVPGYEKKELKFI